MTEAYKTVFILGAGASRDFGFPTGEELLKDIDRVCDACLEDCADFQTYSDATYEKIANSQLSAFVQCISDYDGYDRVKLEQYLKRLKGGLPLSKSIDNFLYDQSGDDDFRDFGKTIIAVTLLLRERGNQESNYLIDLPTSMSSNSLLPLDFFELRKTWFVTFFRELRTDNGRPEFGLEGFKKRLDEIAVITFNYDRSFEFLMRQAISQYQAGIEVDDIRDVLSHLTIIHPYGDLGNFEALPYGTPLGEVKDWRPFQERIQIFMEPPNEETMLESREVIAKAKTLVFLGFGFHAQNMEFLGLSDWSPENAGIQKIYATAYGQSDYKRDILHKRLVNLLFRAQTEQEDDFGGLVVNRVFNDNSDFVPKEKSSAKDEVKVENATCRDLLDEYGDDIFNIESDKPPSDKDLLAPVY